MSGYPLRFYRLTSVTALGLVLLIGAALLIGRAQQVPDRVALLHLDACSRPCWIGITPGVTTLDEANQRIRQVFPEPRYRVLGPQGNYTIQDSEDQTLRFSVYMFIDETSRVEGIRLEFDQVYIDGHWIPNPEALLTFGDLNKLWGSPKYIEVWRCYGDWLPQYDTLLDTYVVVEPSKGFPDASARASWENSVKSIQLFVGEYETADYTMLRQWHGFLSYRGYGYRDYAVEQDGSCSTP